MSKGSDAGASPISPVAEKAALEWLVSVCPEYDCEAARHVRTVKALLAEPRLPVALTDAQIEDIWQATAGGAGRTHRQYVEDVLLGIREALTAPKTKTVWRVCWKDGDRKTVDIESIDGAMTNVRALLGCGVSVTIEHVEVPND